MNARVLAGLVCFDMAPVADFPLNPACGDAGRMLIHRKDIMTYPVSASRIPAWTQSVLACAISACFISPALAQATPEAEKALGPVVVTATRTAQSLTDVLSDTVVIGNEEIMRSGQTSLVGLLQRQRGIEITQNGGPGTYSSVFMRGTDNRQHIVLIDGIRTSSTTDGGANWAALPLANIDHIEIVYGSLSSLYGADAMGGVIQIFTKQGSGAPQFSASAGAGRYGTRTLDASLSGATGGAHSFHYAISASQDKSDGFSASKPAAGRFTYNPDRDGYSRDSVNGQFSLDLAQGHEVGMRFLQSRLDAQFDAGAGYDDRGVQKIENLAVFSKNRVLPWWQSQFQLSQSEDKSVTDASYGKSYINSRQKTVSWQNDLSLGTDLLQLLAEHRKEEADTNVNQLNRERTTNSFAASYQLKRGNHLGSVGVRNDNNSQFGSKMTGNLAYGYRISSALRANASYGTSYRAPTFNDLYYPNSGIAANRPEHSKNAELGVHFDNGTSRLSAVAYRNRATDLLVYANTCPVEQATHAFGCVYNVNKATISGLSLSGSTTVQQFTLRAALDFQDPHDDTSDKLLARRAKRHATAGVDYRTGALTTGAEWIVSGQRYDDRDNKQVLNGYGVLNLYSSYDIAAGWTVLGRWNNVLNKDYELSKNYATAGSNLFVGVRYVMK